ncbi:unnamed protein product [Protopolystoma xenopodis]|uniref:Integrase catalytic domain-containing protein n=1 Tax=Protopolystoma xenopodis TaxID=117903 RepID=A0A448WCP7_9PLAT|nr:unnamed protein product [Protopolystoma xenopodis]
MAEAQERESNQISVQQCLKLAMMHVEKPQDTKIRCNRLTDKHRPFVPSAMRKLVFQTICDLAHPGLRASMKLITRHLSGQEYKQTSENHYLLTIMDHFARWSEAIPIPDTQTMAIAETCHSLGFQVWHRNENKITCAYHPQANDLIERFHRQLKACLRCQRNPDDGQTCL